MALVCVVSIISYTPANAKNSNFYTNADQYVADFILGQYKTPDGQNVSMINSSGNPITYEFTYKKISEGIIDKKWLIVGSVFWKNTKKCLDSDFVDLVNWEQIMYESLIMNWLSYEYDSDDYESEFAKTSAKYVFKLQKSIYGDNVEVKDINKIKPGDAKKKMKENFFDKNETWNKIAKGEDIASKVFDAGMEVEELLKQRGDWDQAKAQQIAQDALTQYGDKIEVIFCNNDAMALGALQAIEAAGRKVNEDIYLVGVDALTEAVQNVIDGKQTGTVFNNHFAQAQAASDIAVKFLGGEKVDAVNMVNYEKVTQDNAQEILDMLK